MRSKRTVVLGVLVVAVAAVLLALWLRRDRSPRAAATPASSSTSPAAAAAASATTNRRTPPVRDPEPAGAIRLEGLVVDEHDRPVAGADVELSTRPPRRTQSDTDGSFAIDGLLPQSYVIHAWTRDRYTSHTPFIARPTTEPIILHLRPGNTVAYTVLDAGTDQPIAGAELDGGRGLHRTDAAGKVTVSGLAPWFNGFEIRHPDYAAHLDTFTLSDDPGGIVTRTVRLLRGVAVTARVLGPDGRPVVGAEVEIGCGGPSVSAASGPDGRAVLTPVPPGSCEASAERDGYTAGTTSFECAASGANEVTITLGADSRLDGIVVDASGVGAAGARVTIGGIYDQPRTAITGADGRFAITGLARRRHAVSATLGNAAAVPVEIDLETRDRAEVRLALADGTIAGIVVDERGEPVAEARVNGIATENELILSSATDITDMHGRFELGGLVPGEYRLGATGPDEPDTNRYHGTAVIAATGDTDVRLQLPDTGTITGVVTADGRPVPSYAMLFSASAYSTAFDNPEIVRAADGRFTRRQLAPGTYGVTIVAEGLTRQVRPGVIVEGGRTTDLGTIALDAGREVRGRVVDERGAPVAGAEVFAGPFLLLQGDSFTRDKSWSELRTQGEFATTSAADGSFVLRGVGTGALRLVATQGTRRVSSAVTLGDGATPITLTVAPTGTIAGVVTSVGARRVSIQIELTATHGFAIATGAGRDGRFYFPLVPAGRCTVTADVVGARTDATTSAEVVVEPGATATVTLDGAAPAP